MLDANSNSYVRIAVGSRVESNAESMFVPGFDHEGVRFVEFRMLHVN